MFQIIFGTIIGKNLNKLTAKDATNLLQTKLFYRYKTAADLKDDKGSPRLLKSQISNHSNVQYSILEMI
jgi:hypothetical protein